MDNFKTVYLYNGTPFLVTLDENEEYIYPQQPFTSVAPPSGIYSPFYFDGNKWIGASKEDWEKENPCPVYEPTPIEVATANLQMQLMKANTNQMKAQKQVATLLLDNQKKDNAIKDLQEQHAQMMLEITKLKGSAE